MSYVCLSIFYDVRRLIRLIHSFANLNDIFKTIPQSDGKYLQWLFRFTAENYNSIKNKIIEKDLDVCGAVGESVDSHVHSESRLEVRISFYSLKPSIHLGSIHC